MTIEVNRTKDGVEMGVQVSPGASRSRVMGEHAGRLKVSVSAAPERGKANEAVVELVAKSLGVKRGQVSVVGGLTSKQKTVRVKGLTPEELAGRLREVLGTQDVHRKGKERSR